MFSKERIIEMIKETEEFLKLLKEKLAEEEAKDDEERTVIETIGDQVVTNSNKDLQAVVLINSNTNEYKIIRDDPRTTSLVSWITEVTKFFKICSNALLVVPNDGTLLSCVRYIKGSLGEDDCKVYRSLKEVKEYIDERYHSEEFNNIMK